MSSIVKDFIINLDKYKKDIKNYNQFIEFGKCEIKENRSYKMFIFIASLWMLLSSFSIYLTIQILNFLDIPLLMIISFIVFCGISILYLKFSILTLDIYQKYFNKKYLNKLKLKYPFINYFFKNEIPITEKKQKEILEPINNKAKEYGLENLIKIKNLKDKYKTTDFYFLTLSILKDSSAKDLKSINDDDFFNLLSHFNENEKLELTEIFKNKLENDLKDKVSNNIRNIKKLKNHKNNKNIINI